MPLDQMERLQCKTAAHRCKEARPKVGPRAKQARRFVGLSWGRRHSRRSARSQQKLRNTGRHTGAAASGPSVPPRPLTFHLSLPATRRAPAGKRQPPRSAPSPRRRKHQDAALCRARQGDCRTARGCLRPPAWARQAKLQAEGPSTHHGRPGAPPRPLALKALHTVAPGSAPHSRQATRAHAARAGGLSRAASPVQPPVRSSACGQRHRGELRVQVC